MAGRGVADVVFCLDSSTSMQNTFSQLRTNIASFVSGLRSSGQIDWDLRFEFLSHSTSDYSSGLQYRARSIFEPQVFQSLYSSAGQRSPGRFFTESVDEFCRALESLRAGGDETNLIALDACLDLPWRSASNCQRAVIMLTDEPLETGLRVQDQLSCVPKLIEKIHVLGVILFIIGPASRGYEELSLANRSVYEVVPKSKGLQTVDFSTMLAQIGKSISASRMQRSDKPAPRALFGQDQFVTLTPRAPRGA